MFTSALSQATIIGTADVSVTQANDSIVIYGSDGVANRKVATDASGRVIVTHPVFTRYTAFGSSAGANVKAAAGVIYAFTCYNDGSLDQFFQIINKASAPAGGDTALISFLVPAKSQTFIGTDWLGFAGLACSTGISWGFSSTRTSYTAGTAADTDIQILYI